MNMAETEMAEKKRTDLSLFLEKEKDKAGSYQKLEDKIHVSRGALENIIKSKNTE